MLVTWSIPYSLGDAYVIMLYKWSLSNAHRYTWEWFAKYPHFRLLSYIFIANG